MKYSKERIKEYEKVYEKMSEHHDGPETKFIQLINQNSNIIIRNIHGYLSSKLVSYLVNIHMGERPIYFSRHGESEHNLKHLIGGDASLSKNGRNYAEKLKNFFMVESKKFSIYPDKCLVYCSTLKRTIETSEYLDFLGKSISLKCLDELNVGVCDGMTYEEVKEKYPKDFEERSNR